MSSHIARRAETFGKLTAPVLLIAALIFALIISRQAQTATPKPKPTRTQRAKQQAEQKSARLSRVVFQKDMKAVSYWFRFKSNKQRIVTYRVGKGNSVTADVKATPQGKPLIQLLATKTGVRARTPQGTYKLVRGKRVFPATTDKLSIWLLANNFINNPTTSPQVVYNTAFADLIAANKAKGKSRDTLRRASGGGGGFSKFGDLFKHLFEKDGCPNYSASCDQTDTAGNTSTVTITCSCGTPICQKNTFTVDVPVLVIDADTGEQRVESRPQTFTKCVCVCLTLTDWLSSEE